MNRIAWAGALALLVSVGAAAQTTKPTLSPTARPPPHRRRWARRLAAMAVAAYPGRNPAGLMRTISPSTISAFPPSR